MPRQTYAEDTVNANLKISIIDLLQHLDTDILRNLELLYRVEAETDPENKKSQRVLEKCGFAPLGIIGEEGPRFYREN